VLAKGRLAAVLGSTVAVVACSGTGSGSAGSGSAGSGPDAGARVLTYYDDVAPLLARECSGCHSPGGSGPIRLDSYEAVHDSAELAALALESHVMPPWPPDDSCHTFVGAPGLTDEDRTLLRRWQEDGAREGKRRKITEPDASTFEATHRARMTEPYLPDDTRPDDYRCFVLDLDFPNDMFVRGMQVVPGTSLVHHALVYAPDRELAAEAEARDAEDEAPGYTCFGGPLPAPTNSGGTATDPSALSMVTLGGWVPGQEPYVLDRSRGTFVRKGSKIILQVHYSLLASDPVPDDTYLELNMSPEQPEYLVSATPLAVTDLDIPAGAAHVVEHGVFRNYRDAPMHITGLAPHMHLLGTRISAEKVGAIGADDASQCLVDIPDWDFNWQRTYRFGEGNAVVVKPGEGIVLECSYDNSSTHQPVVNGKQQEPRDVNWGDSTLDEMCLLYLAEETEWKGPPALGCEGAGACLGECKGSPWGCLQACAGIDGACRTCVVSSTFSCAASTCATDLFGATDCLKSCANSYILIGGSFADCVRNECPDEADSALSCVADYVDSGACDDRFAECGVEL
jgi:hypothetical protein